MTAVNQVPITQLASSAAADDYFQTVVITALLAILKDQALSNHHPTVIEAIMSIFKTQGLKCVTFLPQVFRYHFVWCCNLTEKCRLSPLSQLLHEDRRLAWAFTWSSSLSSSVS
jgi:hypothetical protein